MLQFTFHYNMISHAQVKAVLRLQDLDVQLDEGGVVLHSPGTHDSVLILMGKQVQ